MSGETEQAVSGWTTDTLKEHCKSLLDDARREFQIQLDDLRDLLQERYDTQTKALDAAFAAADKAVSAALLAAEKAVGKAEAAAERRFEAVNEFRGQLNDILAQCITRVEADARFASITEKIEANDRRFSDNLTKLETRHNELELRLSNELSTTSGRGAGIDKFREYIGWAVAIGAALWAILTKT